MKSSFMFSWKSLGSVLTSIRRRPSTEKKPKPKRLRSLILVDNTKEYDLDDPHTRKVLRQVRAIMWTFAFLSLCAWALWDFWYWGNREETLTYRIIHVAGFAAFEIWMLFMITPGSGASGVWAILFMVFTTTLYIMSG